jgi:hypothetical protein
LALAARSTKRRKRKRGVGYDRYTSAAYRPYVTAIGQIALAWNDLHETLCSLFVTLTVAVDPKIDAAWQSLPSDRAKRGMLRAAIGQMYANEIKLNPRAQEEMKWFLGQLDRLEEDRNNAIHAPLASYSHPIFEMMGMKERGIQPYDLRENRRAANLKNKDLLTEYRWARDAVILMRDYAEEIEGSWNWTEDKRDPWPERPRLPNRGQKSRAKVQPSRRSPARQLPLPLKSSEE